MWSFWMGRSLGGGRPDATEGSVVWAVEWHPTNGSTIGMGVTKGCFGGALK